METLLQQINPGTAALALVGLCGLCLVLPILLSGIHIIAGVIDAIGHVLSLFIHLLSSGPEGWCGCLVAIGGCGLVGLTVWLIASGLSNCATYQTNFCALFGR